MSANTFLQGTARITAKNSDLIARTHRVAHEVAAVHASAVDAENRFPSETFAALKREGLLSASVPKAFGGAGAGMAELAAQCATLAQGCGASGMVLAMHHIQVACMARHGADSPFFQAYLRELVDKQLLMASVTSEVGTWGDTRSSICAIEYAGDRFKLFKDATTVSYGEHGDALLITCRRNAEAAKSDQILVLAKKSDYKLEQTTTWDTLGMRGTQSPGFKVTTEGLAAQVVPGSYADSSALSMVPYSHILWASLWWGIAADAVSRAGAFVRGEARKKPGQTPVTAVRLADAVGQLQAMRGVLEGMADGMDESAH